MTQLAKSLPYKHEDLSSISRSRGRKPGVINTHNCSIGEAADLGSLASHHSPGVKSRAINQKTRWIVSKE